jgi:hypothetical protein
MSLLLFGVAPEDGEEDLGALEVEGVGERSAQPVSLVAFRDLLAIVAEQATFALQPVTAPAAAEHRRVAEIYSRDRPVVPAPVGTLFRDADTLVRWMELHYVALNDALAFVEGRNAVRVHIRRDGRVDPADRDAGTDLASAAAEAYRALRRQAVAAIPLKLEQITGMVLSGAFLVDRNLWAPFMKVVEQQRREHRTLRFELTGPWAPYDFVRMRFGG